MAGNPELETDPSLPTPSSTMLSTIAVFPKQCGMCTAGTT